MKHVAYCRGYGPREILQVREISYDPSEDILILVLDDYTTLFASYIEKNADGWEAGIPENY
jgi:hypothetical protein